MGGGLELGLELGYERLLDMHLACYLTRVDLEALRPGGTLTTVTRSRVGFTVLCRSSLIRAIAFKGWFGEPRGADSGGG